MVSVAIVAALVATTRRSPRQTSSPSSAAAGSSQPSHVAPKLPSAPRSRSAKGGADHGPTASPNSPRARRPANRKSTVIGSRKTAAPSKVVASSAQGLAEGAPSSPSKKRLTTTPSTISATRTSVAGAIALTRATSVMSTIRWPASVARHPRRPKETGSG